MVASGVLSPVHAANFTASNQAELVQAINNANASGDARSTITLTGSFVVAGGALPSVAKSLTVDAGAFTLSTTGNGTYDVAAGATLHLKSDIDGTGKMNKSGSCRRAIASATTKVSRARGTTNGQAAVRSTPRRASTESEPGP